MVTLTSSWYTDTNNTRALAVIEGETLPREYCPSDPRFSDGSISAAQFTNTLAGMTSPTLYSAPVASLDDLKRCKKQDIEAKTDALYAAGTPTRVGGVWYRFDTQTGKRAASRWKTLDSVLWRVSTGELLESAHFPLQIESLTNASGAYAKTILSLASFADADTFYKELMTLDQAIATSGTALLLQVEAATSNNALNAVQDTRTVPYMPA